MLKLSVGRGPDVNVEVDQVADGADRDVTDASLTGNTACVDLLRHLPADSR